MPLDSIKNNAGFRSPIPSPNQPGLRPAQENLELSKIESKEDLEAQPHNEHPIYYFAAASEERRKAIKSLLREEFDANACHVNHIATPDRPVKANHIAIDELLLNYGDNPDRLINGIPLLSIAIENGKPEIVEKLLAALFEKKPNYLNFISTSIPEIFSDLQNFAIEKNSQNIIEILLRHRIRLEPLLDLAIEKACPAAVELLLKIVFEENKVNFDSLLNQEDSEKNFASLLCFAIENNSLELMEFLVNNGTTLAQGLAVIASLEIAIKKKNHVMLERLVVALLRKKEDYFNLIPTEENSGKELVFLFGFLWTEEYSKEKVISPFRSFVWTKDFPEKKLIALLCFASATNNSLSLIKTLVEHGANPYKEAFGITALGIAIKTNNPEIVEALIKASMQKNKDDFNLLLALEESKKKPASLLDFAIKTNSLNLINILVRHGANPDEQYEGASALDRVIRNDDAEKVEILANTLIERNKNYFARSFIGGGLDKIRQAVKGKKYKAAQKMRHMAAAQLFPKGLVWFGKMYVWFLTSSVFNFAVKPSTKSLKA